MASPILPRRELRELTRGSFAELIEAVSQREPVRQHAAAFRTHVDRALLAGGVLLLVDGLDEISDPGDRAAFVCTLRAALRAYSGVAIVLTSREAGFRHVAAHLAPVCTHATVSPFDADDIRRLSVAWHREVVGDTEKVRADAEQLAATIVQNDRISRLAVNPLLLTTLLLVKRWVGALPTRRAVLYGKAVELLLMTWNTEGHEPIPEEEAMPQLCYVASAMMLEGVQKISRPRLATLLQQARASLPTELGYVKEPVDQFIQRVEDRSSLLMMTGLDVENGRLVEFFEFRHLTFQEFLTARAMVEGWHPDRKESDTLVSVLEPHFNEQRWSEVIPLAAVLGGKATEALLQRLTETVKRLGEKERKGSVGREPEDPSRQDGEQALFALTNCLADESAARPETIRMAVRELVGHGSALYHQLRSGRMLAQGRYGAELRDEAGKSFLAGRPNLGEPGDALLLAIRSQTPDLEGGGGYAAAAEEFARMLGKPDLLSRCEGALGVGLLCQKLVEPTDMKGQAGGTAFAETLRSAGPHLLALLFGDTPAEHCSALFALGPFCELRIWVIPKNIDVWGRVFRLWQDGSDRSFQHLAPIVLVSQPIVSRDGLGPASSIPRAELESVLQNYARLDGYQAAAALILAWYLGALSDDELREHISKSSERFHFGRSIAATMQRLLEHIGTER